MKVLQDIWILTNSGIVLFNRVFDKQMKTQLFGALMSALNMFAEQISKDGLSNFELSKKRFTLLKRKGLLFIGTCDKKSKEKKVITELEKISNRFIHLYPEALDESWDGDITNFSTFKEKIEEI